MLAEWGPSGEREGGREGDGAFGSMRKVKKKSSKNDHFNKLQVSTSSSRKAAHRVPEVGL